MEMHIPWKHQKDSISHVFHHSSVQDRTLLVSLQLKSLEYQNQKNRRINSRNRILERLKSTSQCFEISLNFWRLVKSSSYSGLISLLHNFDMMNMSWAKLECAVCILETPIYRNTYKKWLNMLLEIFQITGLILSVITSGSAKTLCQILTVKNNMKDMIPLWLKVAMDWM